MRRRDRRDCHCEQLAGYFLRLDLSFPIMHLRYIYFFYIRFRCSRLRIFPGIPARRHPIIRVPRYDATQGSSGESGENSNQHQAFLSNSLINPIQGCFIFKPSSRVSTLLNANPAMKPWNPHIPLMTSFKHQPSCPPFVHLQDAPHQLSRLQSLLLVSNSQPITTPALQSLSRSYISPACA